MADLMRSGSIKKLYRRDALRQIVFVYIYAYERVLRRPIRELCWHAFMSVSLCCPACKLLLSLRLWSSRRHANRFDCISVVSITSRMRLASISASASIGCASACYWTYRVELLMYITKYPIHITQAGTDQIPFTDMNLSYYIEYSDQWKSFNLIAKMNEFQKIISSSEIICILEWTQIDWICLC